MPQVQGTGLLRQIRKLVAIHCPAQLTDLQLLQRFITDRDESAFAAIVQRHGGMVLGVCRGILHHQQDAEDVFQAAFLVLARKATSIRKQQSLSSWLHGVAYRLALKSKVQGTRRRNRELAAPLAAESERIDDLSFRELRVILHEELHVLPEKYRAPLLLCYWEGKTRDEAATLLGVSADALKKHLERARSLLGSRLTRRGLVPSAAFFSTLLCENLAQASASSVLTKSTAQAAVAFASGSGTGLTTATVLAEGVIRTMNMTKCVSAMLVILFLGVLGTGLGLMTQQVLEGRPIDVPVRAVADAGSQVAQGNDKKTADPKTDKDRFVGVWRIAKGLADGKEIPADATAFMRLTFTKDAKVIATTPAGTRVGVEKADGAYKLGEPGIIDLTLNSPEMIPSIYKFEGNDRVTICGSAKDAARPTEFTGEKGSNQMLFVLQRVDPNDDKKQAEDPKNKAALDKVREAAARNISANNLKQIGLAVHNDYDVHKSIVPHAIFAKDGKTPNLSWRVAILPYIEQDVLYKKFKLDEPWDSAHNKKLIPLMPRIYAHPAVAKKDEGLTYYQVFTGPGSAFDGDKKMTFNDITDGTSNTALVVEAKDPVIWTKPADLKLPKEKEKMPALGGHFSNGFHVLMFDGSVRMMFRNTPEATLRAIATPAGGEVIEQK